MAGFLYNDVAAKMETEIKNLAVGTKLPSEREMAAKYGVSRNVLREALRLLSEKGILVIQPGRGVYVADESRGKFADRLEDLLESSDSKLTDIVEVCRTLELGAVQKAVDKATAKDIDELLRLYDAMEKARDDIQEFNRLDRQFHVRLAKCTQNSIYQILLEAFFQLTDEKLFVLNQLFPSRINSAQREHKAFIQAIQQRDHAKAAAAAEQHFNINDILSGKIREKERAQAATPSA